MADVPIQMDINAAGWGEQIIQNDDCFVEPFEIGVEMGFGAAPDVAVGFEFEQRRLFGEALAALFRGVGIVGNGRRKREVGAGIEGRIDINQVHFRAEFGQ